eukprot:CAMPEP_0185159606 /NCGR_PEP_ID=MMETSP1139-20130426/3144_1 /TAXON_ID=298111 /ORGANISM="Pavlova sp., Strain CCMP459" /LENGTH=208 /DNA_ID=CAMNT_0027724783 /DNA_START=119 /DNA_END=745 /DNA_ORIENTATION=+
MPPWRTQARLSRATAVMGTAVVVDIIVLLIEAEGSARFISGANVAAALGSATALPDMSTPPEAGGGGGGGEIAGIAWRALLATIRVAVTFASIAVAAPVASVVVAARRVVWSVVARVSPVVIEVAPRRGGRGARHVWCTIAELPAHWRAVKATRAPRPAAVAAGSASRADVDELAAVATEAATARPVVANWLAASRRGRGATGWGACV